MENEKYIKQRQELGAEKTQKRVEFLNAQISKFEENIKKFQYELSSLDLSDEQAIDIHRLIDWAKRAKRDCEKTLQTVSEQEASGDLRN